MTLETLEVETGDGTTGSVIWMHGLGADATDFEPIVPMLDLNTNLRFVFPNAPVRPVTINAGMEMRAWYDIDPGAPLSGEQDIQAAADAVAELIEAEAANGTPYERIALAGFSQGGVIALQLGLSFNERLAGIMALSTYVHDHEHLSDRVSFANIDIPIFMAHGQMDPMIPITRAITSREALLALNYHVQWREYGMGHQVCPEEIRDIAGWLNQVFA
ncbi:MAG: dienelactone hydrolase family protein [Pseudomonadales bacterium]|jgi:phospholipase/carboxylesterase|nr:dienelactone hydrolase family protein [Pseudomonadales bacterium]MDP6470974.1 dienelactone hydrolase family protein [Pseudomonadales bacterium]MDP6825841.1 dienelactone hydrolase family protein [Pseudomonadales bacterium]MDP6972439.1 dienelactone hydrolase family protein [Pseudomonadales bacterium]|tara:strand:- start:413 stop:1063 length:651 start_codon:yes stop_codon:yes gene_type:complete